MTRAATSFALLLLLAASMGVIAYYGLHQLEHRYQLEDRV